MTRIQRFLKDESGATAIEYGLIAALIAVALIGAMMTVSDDLEATYDFVGTQLENANATAAADIAAAQGGGGGDDTSSDE